MSLGAGLTVSAHSQHYGVPETVTVRCHAWVKAVPYALLCAVFCWTGLVGCTDARKPRQEEVMYLNGSEFLANIVYPVLNGITNIAESYIKNERLPDNWSASASSTRLQSWTRVDSELYGTTDAVFRLSLPPSVGPTDGGGTSWLVFAQIVSEKKLHFRIAAESPVCVRFEREYSDSRLKLFVDLAAGYLVKGPLKQPSDACFRAYSRGISGTQSDGSRKRLEKLMDQLRREQGSPNPGQRNLSP